MFKKIGFTIGMMFLMNACATTSTPTAKPAPATKTNTTATKKGKPAPQQPSAKAQKKPVGPATQKVEARQAEIQDEFDFTLGEPLNPTVRKRIEKDQYSKAVD